MMMFHRDDEKSKTGKFTLADNGIDCCVNVVDDELEEGEIVDDIDDHVDQKPVDQLVQPRQHKINRSWIMNECSVDMERGFESYSDSRHGLKRHVDDVDWVEDCMARNKRRRFNPSKDMHRVIRNAKLDKTKNDTDGHSDRETYYGGNVEQKLFPREFKNEGCDFQHLKHVRCDRKRCEKMGNFFRHNNRHDIPSTSRLLLKNAFEDHSSMLVRKNSNGPSLFRMHIPVPEGLKVTYFGNKSTSLASLQEPIVEDISVSIEEVTVAQIVYPPASDNYEESSDDDDEMDNLVIDEGL